MASYGLIEKLVEKIKRAPTPSRFTQDYLSTQLNMPGGSAMALIPLFKKLGFIGSDGVPTESYKKFRNESSAGGVMANAIRHSYKELYSRNEYAHRLTKEKLQELIKEVTGAAEDSSTLRQIVGTFEALKRHANFESTEDSFVEASQVSQAVSPPPIVAEAAKGDGNNLGLNLSYTINLNLPATSDVAVFNAIFKSLKENLLQNS